MVIGRTGANKLIGVRLKKAFRATKWCINKNVTSSFFAFILFSLTGYPTTSFAQKLTTEMLGMPREEINLSDDQLRLFNGRGCIYAKQYSLTGMHRIQFPPVDIRQYQFRLDFRDEVNNILVQDNIPELWEDFKEKGSGYDPLGVNFRAGYPYAVLSQNEYWEPNSYRREGTYHKKYGENLVSFSIITESMVSGSRDEVYLEIRLTNRGDQPLKLTLIPVQWIRFEDSLLAGNDQVYRRLNAYTLQNAQYRINLSSDLKLSDEEGWKWMISGNESQVARFIIQTQPVGEKQPDRYRPDVRQRIGEAQETTRRRLQWTAERLPVLKTEYSRLDDFYKRCILTVSECRWERENFIVNPFWASGSWIFSVPWDLCFLSDMLTMMSPESMRETIELFFREGDIFCTYISWDGCAPGVFYIMQPFALKLLIDGYLRQTGDVAFLSKKISGKSLLSWLKAWGDLLHNDFTSKTSGLLDIGPDTEALVEIRTDGFDYAVPVLNGLTVEYYNWLASYCRKLNDSDSSKFDKRAADLEKGFHENLWNAEKRWFDNLYPDGGRASVYSNLMFDLLGTSVLTGEERLGLLSHLNDNEFLGPYSLYSMSRQDVVHWDRVDADWGGGGSYTGIPLQLVRNLYQTGMGQLAWTILSRFTQYVDHFPYISQNFRADQFFQDESSQPMAVCAGAGVEAIIFGLFGISPHIDGSLDIHPYYAHELGDASLRDYQFHGHHYDIMMNRYGFKLSRDGNLLGSYHHGQSVKIHADGHVMTFEERSASNPVVQTDTYEFVDKKEIVLKTATAGAAIYYTLDGGRPTEQSTAYEGPFVISQSCQLKAIAICQNLTPSEISVIHFKKIRPSEVESPPLMIRDFLISQSFHGYVGQTGKNEYPLGRTDIHWKKANVDERGIVWLSQQLTPYAYCHAFAVTEIICKEDIKSTLLTGTNDGAFIWLNGQLILDSYKERPLYYNQFKLPVTLQRGTNTLVLMILQAGGSWGFHVNIKTPGQKPDIRLPDFGD